MWSALLATIRALLCSKKAAILGAAALTGVGAALSDHASWGQIADYMKPILLTYIGAQGIQDGRARLRK